jgi:hypothetical protein
MRNGHRRHRKSRPLTRYMKRHNPSQPAQLRPDRGIRAFRLSIDGRAGWAGWSVPVISRLAYRIHFRRSPRTLVKLAQHGPHESYNKTSEADESGGA